MNIATNKIIHSLYLPPQIFKSSPHRNCQRFCNISHQSYKSYKSKVWLMEHMRGKCKYQSIKSRDKLLKPFHVFVMPDLDVIFVV